MYDIIFGDSNLIMQYCVDNLPNMLLLSQSLNAIIYDI